MVVKNFAFQGAKMAEANCAAASKVCEKPQLISRKCALVVNSRCALATPRDEVTACTSFGLRSPVAAAYNARDNSSRDGVDRQKYDYISELRTCLVRHGVKGRSRCAQRAALLGPKLDAAVTHLHPRPRGLPDQSDH
jgi:hypothetical protein